MKKSKLILLVIAVFAFMTALAVFASAADYCAVGEVKDGKAAILKADGSIVEAPFTGTAPTSGTVYAYSEENGVYTFTEAPIEWAVGTGYDSWRLRADGTNAFYDADGTCTTMVPITAETPIFVKFSDTSWRVYLGPTAINIGAQAEGGVGDWDNTSWPANIQAVYDGATGSAAYCFIDVNNNGYLLKLSEWGANDPENHHVLTDPTKYFDRNGLTSGDKDVVLGNEQPPQTADVISVVAIVALVSFGGTALLIRKKH